MSIRHEIANSLQLLATWHGDSIGNKALIPSAIDELRKPFDPSQLSDAELTECMEEIRRRERDLMELANAE